jgi:hypothetical protein
MQMIAIDWSNQYESTDDTGKVWRFEVPNYGGPWPLRKDGELFRRYPGPRSRFWQAYERWRREKPEELDEPKGAIFYLGETPEATATPDRKDKDDE